MTVLKRWVFQNGSNIQDQKYFLQCIENERLQQLVWEVIERIPAHVRRALRGKNVVVVEDEYIALDGALGGAVTVSSADQTRRYHLIRISPHITPDAFCRFVLAHECAHVLLGHPDIVVLQELAGDTEVYSQEEVRAFDLLVEEHASYQAFMWGFQDDAEAVFGSLGKETTPRWWRALTASQYAGVNGNDNTVNGGEARASSPSLQSNRSAG